MHRSFSDDDVPVIIVGALFFLVLDEINFLDMFFFYMLLIFDLVIDRVW